MAITATLLVKQDLEINGRMLPAGEYEGVHVPPFSGSASEAPQPATWRLLSKHGMFDVGAFLQSGDIVPLID